MCVQLVVLGLTLKEMRRLPCAQYDLLVRADSMDLTPVFEFDRLRGELRGSVRCRKNSVYMCGDQYGEVWTVFVREIVCLQ